MRPFYIWNEHRAFWWCVTIILIGGAIGLALTDEVQTMLRVGNNRTSFANIFFTSITLLGEHYLYFLLGIILIIKGHQRLGLTIGSLGMTVLALSFVLKMYFGTPRPAAILLELGLLSSVESIRGVTYHFGNTSFPSGHTMSAFALFGFLALLQPKRPWFVALLLIIAIGIGASRVYLLQHFPSDVMAGATIGLLLAIIWNWLYIEKWSVKKEAPKKSIAATI